MKTFVLDASSLLRHLDDGPGADRVEDLLNQAARDEVLLLISAFNWGEVIHVLYKKNDVSRASFIASHLSTLPIEVVPVDKEAAEAAAIFKHAFKLPYADAFAGSLTKASSHAPQREASLVTADFDFKTLPKGTIKVEFLPIK
jgi:predicted nucleic acid-binding protein